MTTTISPRGMRRIKKTIEPLTVEQFADFLVLQVTETYKKTLVRNGGIFLGRLLEAQGNYIASRKRRGNKARFKVQTHVERQISHLYGVIFYQLYLYADEEWLGKDRQAQYLAELVQVMCRKLFDAIHEESNEIYKK
jgi:hypothetical protein